LNLPKSGKVFLSFRNDDKEHAIEIAKQLIAQNYSIVATSGTASVLEEQNITIEKTNKVKEGRPNITDMLKNNEISLIFNVPSGKQAYEDSTVITKIAQEKNIPVITTVTGALATVQALQTLKSESFKVKSIQDYKKEFEEALARV
jgi:carbamoyl-phosphate synthase large subunit